jgi:hypothetical protein
MPNPRSLVVVTLLTLAACAAEPGRSLPAGHVPGGGKADDPNAQADFDRLVSLLRADGTLTLPPLGVEHAANVMDVTVTVHAADEVKEVARGLIAEISEEYAYDPATGTLVDHYDDDVNVSLVSAWNDAAIERALLEAVDAEKRAAVSSLLDGYLLHFRIYQTASEITAEEIFVFRPTSLDRAILVRISYAHA